MTDFRQIFHKLRPLIAPMGLKAAIVARIRFEERRAARRVVFITTPILALSFAGLAWGVMSAASSLAHSSLGQYLSLAVSDPMSVATLWQSFSLTIIESLPIFALTIICGTLIALLTSIFVAAHNVKRAFSFA